MTSSLRLFVLGTAAAVALTTGCALPGEHHPDAERLQRDLAAVPGVASAEADYSVCWLECSGDPDEAYLSTTVTLAQDARPEALAAVIGSTRRLAAEHPGWDVSLAQQIGADLVAGLPPAEVTDLPGAAQLFLRARSLGAVRGYFDGADTLDLDVDLPVGTTGAHLRPAYVAISALKAQEPPGLRLQAAVTAADGSGFVRVPTSAQWTEWERLVRIQIPGARTAVRFRAIGSYDLVLHPEAATASLDVPAFRAAVAAAVRSEVVDLRSRTGGGPSITVWIGDRPVVDVGPSDCGHGLSSLDDELNAWFWGVDCASAGTSPTDPQMLDRYLS